MTDHFETTISSEEKYKGCIIRVTLDTARLENGELAMRDVVHHNGGAAVIAIDENGEIALVTQFRYALKTQMIEIPAGKLELNENPFEAAKRELAEEAGIIARDYIDLGYIVPTCGFCNEKIYLYAAKNLSKTNQKLDEDEFVSVMKVPLEKAVQMCLDNKIVDSKTVAAIFKLKALRERGEF